MDFTRLESEKEIDDFLIGATPGGAEFLPSSAWAKNMRREGEEAISIGVREDGKLLALATLVKRPLAAGKLGYYWYSPRGPVSREFPPEKTASIIDFLAQGIGQIDRRAVFWRLEPNQPLELGRPNLLRTLDLQPAKTLILSLQPGVDDLLKGMSQKTRYNVRLAEKKGVRVISGQAADWPEFWRLMQLTGRRDAFRLHEADHYKSLFAALDEPGGFLRLLFAEYEGRKIATGIFCFFGGRATYLHGASDDQSRQVMAPYLLQWEAIKQAKAGGLGYYDFYGISEEKWPGVTRFKKGFGGEEKDYPGTFDFVFRPFLYRFYLALRKLRRLV